MARELPIHNGRMTTDLDANGFKIKNLPPGSGFTQAQADWNQADATAPDFVKNKPTIPAAVTVDPTLTRQGAAADAKAVGDALRGGFTEWELDSGVLHLAWTGTGWEPRDEYGQAWGIQKGNLDSVSLSWTAGVDAAADITATRHAFPPTKTSQLTNDGAPDGGGTPFATTAQIPDVTGKADKAVPSAAGNLASLNAQGNLVDSGVKPSDLAAKSDLPYRLVEPGVWEFSGLPSGATNVSIAWNSSAQNWSLTFIYDGDAIIRTTTSADGENALSLVFDGEPVVTATRASLPGHLLDRAGNRVVVTGATTLTLPEANPGCLRDFLVRLEISGSTVPTITFAAPTGETITYETDGDEFPVPDEAGDWLYSFTESCVAHTFAVALKKVNTVAAPQAQGGS